MPGFNIVKHTMDTFTISRSRDIIFSIARFVRQNLVSTLPTVQLDHGQVCYAGSTYGTLELQASSSYSMGSR